MSDTVAGRLRDAVRAWGSVNRFTKEMQQRNAPGGSVGAVYRYLNGETEPSVAFLAIAGVVLGVSPAWLAFGDQPADAECPRCAMHEHRIEKAIAVLRDG